MIDGGNAPPTFAVSDIMTALGIEAQQRGPIKGLLGSDRTGPARLSSYLSAREKMKVIKYLFYSHNSVRKFRATLNEY